MIELKHELGWYKINGVVQFDEVLKIQYRMQDLITIYGREKMTDILVLTLTAFVNSFNLVRPMTVTQVWECAIDLIASCVEDNLALEDYLLFFEGAKKGEYGKVYDRMDQQTVFEMFEAYREERYRVYVAFMESRHAQYKGMGPSDKMPTDELQNAMANIIGRMENMKERLKDKAND